MDDQSLQADARRVPEHVKEELFGAVGFCKWTNCHVPIKIINPFAQYRNSTLPSGIYHAWMHEVDTTREKTPLLIYWYGTEYEFSIIPLEAFVPWQKGVQQGYHQIPEFMLDRLNRGKPVPECFSFLQSGLQSLQQENADLLLVDHPSSDTATSTTTSGTTKTSRYTQNNNDNNHKNPIISIPKSALDACELNEWHALALTPSDQQVDLQARRKELSQEFRPFLTQSFGRIGFLNFDERKNHNSSNSNKKKRSRTEHRNSTTTLATHFHPVLVVSPFRAPPGKVRKEWFTKYSKATVDHSNVLPPISLVYWLGAFTAGQERQGFSFVATEKIVKCADGMRQGYHQIPQHIQDSYHSNTASPSITIDWWMCGIHELKLALKVPNPHHRWAGLQDFEETYKDDWAYYKKCVAKSELTNLVMEDFEPHHQDGEEPGNLLDTSSSSDSYSCSDDDDVEVVKVNKPRKKARAGKPKDDKNDGEYSETSDGDDMSYESEEKYKPEATRNGRQSKKKQGVASKPASSSMVIPEPKAVLTKPKLASKSVTTSKRATATGKSETSQSQPKPASSPSTSSSPSENEPEEEDDRKPPAKPKVASKSIVMATSASSPVSSSKSLSTTQPIHNSLEDEASSIRTPKLASKSVLKPPAAAATASVSEEQSKESSLNEDASSSKENNDTGDHISSPLRYKRKISSKSLAKK